MISRIQDTKCSAIEILIETAIGLMDDTVTSILTDSINKPVEMIELLSSGNLVEGTATAVADIWCHPGTPIVLTFPDFCVVFTCESNARISVRQFPKNFNLDDLFQTDPVMYDEEHFISRIPLFHFLEGPHVDCFYSKCIYVDSFTLIIRKDSNSIPVLAAIVLLFHDSLRFGFGAAHESHFSYCYNEHCDRLITEASNSSKHLVHRIVRPDSCTREISSMLWMAE